MSNEIILAGCTPTPLASYLKALGVFRLVSEQVDPKAKGCWRNDQFILISQLSDRDVSRFFTDYYQPTPIISPWNGRAGFLEGEDGESSERKGAVIIRRVLASQGKRLNTYRKILNEIKQVPIIRELNAIRTEAKELEKQKKKNQPYDNERLKHVSTLEKQLKGNLLWALRSELDEEFVQWLDACQVLTESPIPTPLLGSGGNEGSMDFSVNHLLTLTELIDPDSDKSKTGSQATIEDALFGMSTVVTNRGNPGFLSPVGVGGPNMGSGFEGTTGENPWNTVLMLEGVLLFLATVTRRLNTTLPPTLSFPFVVDAIRAGHGGLSSTESARPEFWAPIWDEPISLLELRALLEDGRATIRGRQARNGLDMIRAISTLGVNRGISYFQRYGFFERRGQGYYVAAPLNRVPVERNPAADIITDLESSYWLEKFRRLSRAKNVSAQIQSLVRKLEDSLFELSLEREDTDTAPKVQKVLKVLGDAQLYFAHSPATRESCPPVPSLSRDWFIKANDNSHEFSIAAALASLHARKSSENGKMQYLLSMRVHLAPEQEGRRPEWLDSAGHQVTWGHGRLEDNLATTLQRRLLFAEQQDLPDKPFCSARNAPLDAIAAWLDRQLDSSRIAALLPGLALVQIPAGFIPSDDQDAVLPAAYRVLKPFFCTNEQLQSAGLIESGAHLPIPAEMARRLTANDIGGAVSLAQQGLRIAGLAVRFPRLKAAHADGRHLLAALMAPISNSNLKTLLPSQTLYTTQTEMTE